MKNGILPTDSQLEQIEQYVHLLLEWNKKINLISRKDEENVWTYHILHSVSPLFKITVKEGCTVVDIGTGGGLPGIPLKILRPDISLICLDATKKKVHAVLQMVNELKLERVHIVWGRADEIGIHSDYVHKFDYAVARAVCQLDELLSLSANFLKGTSHSGSWIRTRNSSLVESNPPALIAFKGGDLKQELDRARRKFPQVDIDTIELAFPGSEQLIASDKKLLLVHL
jgi:16S rRNA (guanine(527)-N(7))-methyltransferase RsmG